MQLTIATTDYDHFRDFRLGLVSAEGIEANWLTLGHHEIFSRFTFNREWDVSELSFVKFAAQVTRENSDIALVRGGPILERDDFDLEALPLGKAVAPDHHRKASVALWLDQPVPPELKLKLLLLRRGAARYQEHKR